MIGKLSQIAEPKGWELEKIYERFPRLAERRNQDAIDFHRKFRASLNQAEADTAGQCEPGEEDTCAIDEEPMTREEELASTKIFACPELGCTAVFAKYGNLQRHLTAGNHRYRLDKESMLDAAAHEYVARIQARGLEPVPLRGEGNQIGRAHV